MQKKLAIDNEYYIEYMNSPGPKGDVAVNILGKSEDDLDQTSVVWHPVVIKMMPWRVARIKTTKGEFMVCAALEWWAPKNQKDFLQKLSLQSTIETAPITIYLWKLP